MRSFIDLYLAGKKYECIHAPVHMILESLEQKRGDTECAASFENPESVDIVSVYS